MPDIGDIDGARQKEMMVNDMLISIVKSYYHKTNVEVRDGVPYHIADTGHPYPFFAVSMHKNYMEGVETQEEFLDALIGDLKQVTAQLEMCKARAKEKREAKEKEGKVLKRTPNQDGR